MRHLAPRSGLPANPSHTAADAPSRSTFAVDRFSDTPSVVEVKLQGDIGSDEKKPALDKELAEASGYAA